MNNIIYTYIYIHIDIYTVHIDLCLCTHTHISQELRAEHVAFALQVLLIMFGQTLFLSNSLRAGLRRPGEIKLLVLLMISPRFAGSILIYVEIYIYICR